MLEVNFNSAPEGATHYHINGSAKWFKATKNGVQYFERGEWHDAGHYGIGVVANKAIARDSAATAGIIASYFMPRSMRV